MGDSGGPGSLNSYTRTIGIQGSRRVALTVVLCLAMVFSGCASYSQHLVSPEHPWHAVPAYVGFTVGFVVSLPLVLVAHIVTLEGSFLIHYDPPEFETAVGEFWKGFAIAFGTPFYVLGLPFDDSGYRDWDGEPPPIPPELWEPPPIPPEFRDPPPTPKTDAP